MNPARRDSGQIGVVIVALAVVVLVATRGVSAVGSTVAEGARAQGIADSVALALASGRSDVVRSLVRSSGAVVSIVDDSDFEGDVTVRVSVGDSVAVARATTSG